ncbi:beta strand repeat-containing protein [Duganella phyllosphaerae]|uniref:Bacterial Ig-like domain protein n=1 Tax=Duganella phyllosphaerae TaxID=762836 RepID=A0A1E7X6U5_9BURK|nr:hypothetical protein [Duganella phyllosphaerae]OFA08873.1 bacterial Ig-like domain protein [Duganella phyllosphaerae]
MKRTTSGRRSSGYLLQVFLAFALAAMLAACGGGGASGDKGCTTLDPNRDPALPGCATTAPVTPVAPAPVMTLALTDSTGAALSTITSERPGTLVALFKTGANVAVANTLVTFTSTDRTAVFLPGAGTAITNAAGVASISLPIGATAGAFGVTATASVDGKTATATVNYNVSLPPAAGSASLVLALNDVNGVPTNAVTPARPGSLAATVRDAAGAVIPNALVRFVTTDTTATLVPSTGTALTNAAGVAQVAVPAGSVTGAYAATASITVGGRALTASANYTATIPPVAPVPTPPPPTLTLTLINPAGASTINVAPDSPGTLVATVRDTASAPVANALVTFTSNDRTASLTPVSGTALTDANGRATLAVNAGTSPGGYSATAGATVAGLSLSASTNYAVTFPTLTLSTPALAPASLAAGGTASVSATLFNGGTPYLPVQSVAFSSPCAAAGKARLVTPVNTVNGVATTSYTDLGCGASDPVTASVAYNGSTLTTSATLTVRLATTGQLLFVSALPQNIALKGTGGAGRQETATVTFKVLDGAGKPFAGQVVNFALDTSVGGLALSPATATTGADGTVSTVVSSGTINTPVRVSALLPGGGISTVSDQLVVSTGVPEQASFSLSALVRNVEGGSFNGCTAPAGTTLTARLADRFHNPAPDGTAVSFTAEGGTVDASCLTGETSTTLTDGTVIKQKGTPGECTVRFCAASPRPADGRVTVLAYALGEESFVDANGNNRYDAGEVFTDLDEPFRNDRAVTDANAAGSNDAYASNSATRVAGEPFIDTDGNGAWTTAGNGVYNGVLRAPGAGSGATVHLRQAMVMVLSNSTPAVSLLDQALNGAPTIGTLALSQCVSGQPFVNQTRTFRFAIRDNNPTVFAANVRAAHPDWLFDLPGNPLPAGTRINFSTSNGRLLSAANAVVQNTVSPDAAGWIYSVQMVSDASSALGSNACINEVTSGALTITVTTPNGVATSVAYPVTD